MQVLFAPRLLTAAFLALAPNVATAQSLGGSASSLDRQNRVARTHDFTFLDTPGQVSRFASLGYLVRVRSNSDFDLHSVSFPYARPEVQMFVNRLASPSTVHRAASGSWSPVSPARNRASRGMPRTAPCIPPEWQWIYG